MNRILIILKSAPLLGLLSIIFKHVYWYIKQISGERLHDHWSSGFQTTNLIFDIFEKRNQHLSISVYSDKSEVYKVMIQILDRKCQFHF